MKPIAVVLFATLLISIPGSVRAVEVGQSVPEVRLKGKDGGRVDGSPWSSAEIKGKVITCMVVDPDAKDLNAHVEQALKAKDYPKDRYASIAIINMKATWKPNWIINSILKRKQEEFPDTTYVRDLGYHIPDAWKLTRNNSYAVLTFDSEGTLIFMKDGKLSKTDIEQLIGIIDRRLAESTHTDTEADVSTDQADES